MIKVSLITCTPSPELIVSSCAKLCYSPSSINDVINRNAQQDNSQFIDMLLQVQHHSPLEHVSFTFGIEGVSRVFLAQMTRHRIASYCVQSQRYVQEKGFNFVVPPQIANNVEAKKEFDHAAEVCKQAYIKITSILEKNSGLRPAIEDARYIFPGAIETKLICTFNARSLLNFFYRRCCNRAQWEIRTVATEMLKIVKKIAPSIFAHAGPSCVNGKCKEGKMSCGKGFKWEESSSSKDSTEAENTRNL